MIMLFSLFPCLLQGQKPGNPGEFTRLGVSQVNITPDQPVMMSGYEARKTPSTGIHDSLFASALFFSGKQAKALIITADLIGFSSAIIDSLKGKIYQETGLPAQNVIIIATHNHGGPSIYTYEDKLSPANEDYVRSLYKKLPGLAADAMKNPVLFQMGFGKGSCKLNINRRAVFADGGVGLGRNQDGPCDHELDVIKFVDQQNNLLAVLMNWPCHGTVTGQGNYQLTGDWPASAARFIKKHAGKNVVVAVTAGASADINPIYGPGNDFREVEAVGYHVANEAWKTIMKIKTSPVKSLGMVNSTLAFPGKKPWTDHFPQPSIDRGSNVEIRFTALKLDKLALCGVSGELMTEIGLKIKEASPYSPTMVVTHCNGSSGYLCTDSAFSEGGYEVKASRLMPGVEKPLTKKCIDLLHSF